MKQSLAEREENRGALEFHGWRGARKAAYQAREGRENSPPPMTSGRSQVTGESEA